MLNGQSKMDLIPTQQATVIALMLIIFVLWMFLKSTE